MTAAHLERAGCDAHLTIVSPERSPMEILGARAGQAVAALLRDHGITFRGSTFAMAVDRHELSTVPGRPIPADAVISMPELSHAAPAGLPGDGPIPADAFGRIDGRAELHGRRQSAVATRPLWWPPVKITGRHLGPALDKHGVGRMARLDDVPGRRR